MSKRSGVKGATVPQVSRKMRALERLEKQLKSGKKTLKDGITKVDLSAKDKSRIEKEITILKSRT